MTDAPTLRPAGLAHRPLAHPGTRVLVVGTGTSDAAGLAIDLQQALISVCGVDRANAGLLLDPEDPLELADSLNRAAEQAEELLLIYFLGDALVSPGGEFHLPTAAAEDSSAALGQQALPFSAVRDALAGSRARSIVVVLDTVVPDHAVSKVRAVFAPRAYLLFAVTSGQARRSLALTREWLSVLRDGDVLGPPDLTLDDTYEVLVRRLEDRGMSLPTRVVANTAGQMLVSLNPASGRSGGTSVSTRVPKTEAAPLPRSPYPGLTSFRPEDASFFFGREQLIGSLLIRLEERLDAGGLLPVVGASGAGKSSLLAAGLLPALAAGVLPRSPYWPTMMLSPGFDPIAALARRLALLTDAPADQVVSALRDAPEQVAALIRARLAEPRTDRLVIVVDQFEEIFTLCHDDHRRQDFVRVLNSLAAATTEHPPACLVVVGVRADFFGRATEYPSLRAAFQNLVVVGPMTDDELLSAIVRPAQAAGLDFEAGLPELLLRDLGSTGEGHRSASRLPLLAHVLLTIWMYRHGDLLTVDGYRATGGVGSALARTAEAVYDGLGPDQRAAAQQMFLRMVTVDGGVITRRRVRRADLHDPQVLEPFVNARLVIVDEDVAELTHEALIRAWPRLTDWIQRNRAALEAGRELSAAAVEWQRADRDPAFLYRGMRLDTAAQLSGELDLTALEADFLTAGRRLRNLRARRLRQVTAIMAVLTLLTTASSVVALWLAQSARDARSTAVSAYRAAESRMVAAQSQTLRVQNPRLSRGLAVAAWRIAPTAEATSVLLSAQSEQAVLAGHTGVVTAAQFALDGRTLASASDDGTVRIWDTAGRRLTHTLTTNGRADTVVFTPDGRRLITAGSEGVLGVWDPATGKAAGTPITGPGGPLRSLAMHPAGAMVAAAGDEGILQLTDLATRRSTATVAVGEPVRDLAFSPDGRTIAVAAGNGGVKIWDVADPARPQIVAVLRDSTGAEGVTFSPDARALVTVGSDSTIRLWDLATFRPLSTQFTNAAALTAVAVGPDGRTLAVSSSDRNIRLWVLTQGRLTDPTTLVGHTGVATDVAFAADGDAVASTSADNTVRLWELDPASVAARLCAEAGTALTPEEWSTLIPDVPYQRPC